MKCYFKRAGISLSFFSLFLLFAGCTPVHPTPSESVVTSSNTNTSDAFDALTQEMFIDYASSDTLTLNYTLKNPDSYGITLDTITWGNIPITEEDFLSNKEDTQNYLGRLTSITPQTDEQKLTWDILNYYLELELEGYDYIYFTDHFSSMHGIQSQLPITLAEYAFDDVQDIEDYLALLNSIEIYVEQLLTFENKKANAGYGMCASELLTVIEECKAFCSNPETNMLIEVFPSKLEHLHLDNEIQNTYIKANTDAVLNHVLPAYENIIRTLTHQLSSAPENGAVASYKNGKAYYHYLLKSNVGTDKTAEELIEQTESNLYASLSTLALLSKENKHLSDEISNAAYLLNDPEIILEHFKVTLTKEQFPEGPEVTYTLKNVHPSLSESLSPAMCFIPRIDDIANNQIYLNLSESESTNALMPTLAHEGYPGHLYQMTYFYHTNPNPIRSVYECLGYTEGWATYVESLCYDYCGFSEDLAEFYRTFYQLFSMNLYCRIDLGIHYENWSYEDMANYTTRYMAFDDETLAELYDIILYNPTNYLVYGIGMNEIYELRNTMEETLGEGFDIKDFHKQLLNLGPAPFPIIETYLLVS